MLVRTCAPLTFGDVDPRELFRRAERLRGAFAVRPDPRRTVKGVRGQAAAIRSLQLSYGREQLPRDANLLI